MPIINPIFGLNAFFNKIDQLAMHPKHDISDVVDAFRELGESYVDGAIGYVLIDTKAQPIDSIESPHSNIKMSSAEFASQHMCKLYRDVLTTAKMMMGEPLEQVQLSYGDYRITLIPLVIKGLFLIVLREKTTTL